MTLIPPDGPFNVGCVEIMTPPTKIPADFTPYSLCDEETNLGVFCNLYYPCQDFKEGFQYERKPWFSKKHFDWYCSGFMEQTLHRSFSFLARFALRDVYQHAWVEAPLVDVDEWKVKQCHPVLKQFDSFPLLIVSHGLNGSSSHYSMYCTQMASEGFIVAAIEHRDGSACSSYIVDKDGNDCEIPYPSKDSSPVDETDEERVKLRKMQLEKRRKEISELLNLLETLNSSPKDIMNCMDISFDLALFQGYIDTSHPLIFGHSFGGATTLDVLLKDPRFKCGVIFDLYVLPLGNECFDEEYGHKRPVFFLEAEFSKYKESIEKLNNYSKSQPKGYVEMVTKTGLGHMDQTDVVCLAPSWIRKMWKKLDYGNIDPIDIVRVHRKLMSEYFLTYLESKDSECSLHFLEKSPELLDGFVIGYS